MSQVNSDVKEAVQTTHYIYQSILDLWSMTPIELKMYIAAMFIVSILMQYYKKSFLVGYNKKEKVQKLWKMSFPIGIALAGLGAYLYGDKIHIGYFVLTGLTVSTISMGVHRVMVEYIWPAIKIIIGVVWERITLIIRGKTKDAG